MNADTSLEPCLPVSADVLGFHFPAPQAAPPPEPSRLVGLAPPNLTTEDREKLHTALLRQDSMVSVMEISRDLAEVALDPATPLRQRLDINEQLMKLAGLDKKLTEQAQVGGGVSITINIPAVDDAPSRAITIDQQPTEVVEIDIDPET